MTLRLADAHDGDAVSPVSPVLKVAIRGMYRGGQQILGPIDLSLNAGETLALTGASGVGKTSLLRLIAGLETKYVGSLTVPARVGMVFQEPTLLPWRTALQNLVLTTDISEADALDALDEVGLAARADAWPLDLSLGQQRRLALARAFAGSPDLLLMDEPFVSLDPDLVDEMMVLFARLRAARRVATLLVTHVEAEAEKLASRIVKLGGSPAQVIDSRQNKGAYFRLSASGVTSFKS